MCWWWRSKIQMRMHFFKNRPQWSGQQKILGAEARRDTGRGKDCSEIRDRFADERPGLFRHHGYRTRLRKTPRARSWSGNSGSGKRERRRGGAAGLRLKDDCLLPGFGGRGTGEEGSGSGGGSFVLSFVFILSLP
jgi:hypothetical protein